MDLWIRSQDKDILIKVDNLELDDERNDIYTHNCINNMQMTYTIGRYKTKERALEVLDEINRHIEELYNCKYVIEYDLSSFTYEMPKE